MSVSIFPGNNFDDGINLSNGNFGRVMDLLGLGDVDCCGTWGPDELPDVLDKIDFVLQSLTNVPALDAGTPYVEERGYGGCTIIRCGVPDGYFSRRVGELRTIVTKAINAKQEVNWG